MINLNLTYDYKDDNKSSFLVANCVSLYMSSKKLIAINDIKLKYYFVTNSVRIPCELISKQILEREIFQIKIFESFFVIANSFKRFNIHPLRLMLVDFIIDEKNNVVNIIPIKNEE